MTGMSRTELDLGFDVVDFLFARPMPAEEIDRYLAGAVSDS